jgi:hypothetical protein
LEEILFDRPAKRASGQGIDRKSLGSSPEAAVVKSLRRGKKTGECSFGIPVNWLKPWYFILDFRIYVASIEQFFRHCS